MPAYYRRIGPAERSANGHSVKEQFIANEYTIGPHSPKAQHGGPPAALLLRCILNQSKGQSLVKLGHSTMQLFRPIPLGPETVLTVETTADRIGSKVGHFRSRLLVSASKGVAELSSSASGKAPAQHVVAQLMAVMMREDQVERLPLIPKAVMEGAIDQAPAFPAEAIAAGTAERYQFPTGYLQAKVSYFDSVHALKFKGGLGKGHAGMWFKCLCDLIDGEGPATGAEKLFIMADSGSGVSFYVDFRKHNFSNPDVTLNLFRTPGSKPTQQKSESAEKNLEAAAADWVGMEPYSMLDPQTGTGLVLTRLYDVYGFVGVATQTLVVGVRAKL